MKRNLSVCIAHLVTLLIVTACSDDNRQLTLAVSTEEPAPSIAETVSSQLSDHAIVVDVDIATDRIEIFDSIQTRVVDLAIVEESDHPIPGVVTIAPLYPSVLHVLHNAQTEPADFAELLRSANVYAGPQGGAAHRLLLKLAADFALGDDEYRILSNPWTVTPDVYFIFGGLLTNDNIRQFGDYRFFSFASLDDVPGGSVADAIVLKHHHLAPFLLPRNIYFSLNDGPVTTLSIRTVMIAHEDFSPELATEITSLLFNNAQEFSMDYPLVTRELDAGLNPAELMFPLHQSSRRFLNRDQPGFIERYVDVMALILTVIFALASSLFAFYRHRKQRKKDRVDDFYSEILIIRASAESTTEIQTLKRLRVEALNVQQTVLQLLIDERVLADASLVAFLSLSNQIINEFNLRISGDISS